MPLNFFRFYFIFTLARMARMFIKNKMQYKWEKYLCSHFSMLASPFKQTRVGGGIKLWSLIRNFVNQYRVKSWSKYQPWSEVCFSNKRSSLLNCSLNYQIKKFYSPSPFMLWSQVGNLIRLITCSPTIWETEQPVFWIFMHFRGHHWKGT
jgi:hypothetical protein